MVIAKPLKDLIEAFERLPGIGPKTSQRLTFYLLHVPQEELDSLAEAVVNLKKKTVICSRCFNVAVADPCEICQDVRRNKETLCVVEEPFDVLALEQTGSFKGQYHVLHGAISPLKNIGPEELKIRELVMKVKGGNFKEVILANNNDLEGEATAMYVHKQLKPYGLKITRIAKGVPVGGELEYADEVTLRKALEGRVEI